MYKPTTRRYTSIGGLAVLALGLGLAPCVLAQGADAPTKTAAQIQAEIDTFNALHAAQLSAEQANALLAACQPLIELRAQVEAMRNDPRVLAVLMEIRAAALAGQPISDELAARLAQAEAQARGIETAAPEAAEPAMPEEGAPIPEGPAVDAGLTPEEAMEALAWEIANAAAAALPAEQVSAIATRDARLAASSLLDEVAELAGVAEDIWTEWLEAVVADLAGGEEAPEGAEEALRTFLTRVHGMSAEDIAADRETLVTELVGITNPPASEEDQRAAVAEMLAEHLLHNEVFIPCLAEYAAAVGQ